MEVVELLPSPPLLSASRFETAAVVTDSHESIFLLRVVDVEQLCPPSRESVALEEEFWKYKKNVDKFITIIITIF